MLINCNSCQKKFVVPDSAIPVSGRLVQCSACGNKWTAYPTTQEIKTENKKIIKNKKIKKPAKSQKLKKVDRYSEEYLMKKHGLQIDESEKVKKNVTKRKQITSESKNKKLGFGFYSYLIFFIVFVAMLFGILNLSKDNLINLYPMSEVYIDYLYETVDIIKTVILQLIDQL